MFAFLSYKVLVFCLHLFPLHKVSERGKVVAHLIVAVHSVIDGDKAYPHLREADFGVLAELDVVSAEPGQVLDENDIDTSGLCVSNQALNAGALEVCSRVAVIHIGVHFIPAPLPHIPLKQQLLRVTM